MATRPVRWGSEPAGWLARTVARLERALGRRPPVRPDHLPELPVRLRRAEVAPAYLEAERTSDHRRAGTLALAAAESAISAADWWAADTWAHRALWHYEQGAQPLQAVRAARRIGELRTMAGDPDSARRYFAEAIGEARDLGATREEGLAALGLGRAELDRGNVTAARRLGDIAEGALARADAPPPEIAAARDLHGTEKPVGPGAGGSPKARP